MHDFIMNMKIKSFTHKNNFNELHFKLDPSGLFDNKEFPHIIFEPETSALQRQCSTVEL